MKLNSCFEVKAQSQVCDDFYLKKEKIRVNCLKSMLSLSQKFVIWRNWDLEKSPEFWHISVSIVYWSVIFFFHLKLSAVVLFQFQYITTQSFITQIKGFSVVHLFILSIWIYSYLLYSRYVPYHYAKKWNVCSIRLVLMWNYYFRSLFPMK